MNEFLIIIISIVILIGNIYFTRWVFRIDEIIETQKEQTKLLKIIADKIQTNTNITFEKSIKNDTSKSNFSFDKNVCPVCQKPISEFDKKCTNCGIVISE